MRRHLQDSEDFGTDIPSQQSSSSRLIRSLRRTGRVILLAGLPLVAIGAFAPSASMAAAVSPLPLITKALGGVTSYQVVITETSTGTRARPTGTPPPPRTPVPGRTPGQFRGGAGFGFGIGAGTRTIVSVRKSGYFEELVTISGKDRTGKATTTTVIAYNTKLCSKSGTSSSYSCQTVQDPYTLDPTANLARGTGMSNFTRAGSKTVNGRACDGYSYSSTSQFGTSKGTIYIDHQTSLLCEQVVTTSRHFGTNTPAFTQTSTAIWSHFNDKSLTVPAVP